MTDLSRGRILVTGGAGFIGSALITALNRRGLNNILVADFLGEDEKWKNLAPLQFADYLEADDLLARIDTAPHLFSNIATVFHLGACTDTSEADAAYLIRNNFECTKSLAHFALEGGRRFVYASSAATYGALGASLPETVSLASLRPLNMYAYSKHLFDCYAERAGILPRISGLKYFNVFGPNEDHKGDMRSVVHKAFHQIRESGRLSLFKSYRPEFPDGGQRRDFIYVKDAAAATIFLAENVNGEGLFNIGSGEATTWLSLADAIFGALGRQTDIDFIDMPETLREKYQYYTCANISKLRAAGFTQPITPLADAVRDYVHNYLLPRRRLGDEAAPVAQKPTTGL
ncbi:MAG: ADP-glyceromanno-heptose 6-epimerase [Acidobacteriaceae bacterium]|nr:ADP-glyceromanno-heptose 6-epimerase [Acidobacteriaceae bacterium]MBV9778781.1 ADP-glyceromanno-heptose 6-epimerase [Acidobacteriaceae bacterium]